MVYHCGRGEHGDGAVYRDAATGAAWVNKTDAQTQIRDTNWKPETRNRGNLSPEWQHSGSVLAAQAASGCHGFIRTMRGAKSDSDGMNRENLAIYLNDHLAGSVAALELLDYLADRDGAGAEPSFFRALRDEVAADQDVLRQLLEKFGAAESAARKAGAWLMEKVARLKLRVDGPAGSPMERMEALEALLLGITGKRALWLALDAALGALEGFDFAALTNRANEQIAAVEAKRLEAARETLAG
jgi:hypothetical protein